MDTGYGVSVFSDFVYDLRRTVRRRFHRFKFTKSMLFVILIVCVIWGQSLLPADISSMESHAIKMLVKPAWKAVFPASPLTATLVRKLFGHFSEYMMLGFAVCFGRACRKDGLIKDLDRVFLRFLFVSVVDETLQYVQYAYGRGPSVLDVWIDMSGCMFGFFFPAFFLSLVAVLNEGDRNRNMRRYRK